MRRTSLIGVLAGLVLVATVHAATPPPTMADLKTGRVQAVVTAPGFPDWITPGFGVIWLGNGHAIERIDPKSNAPQGYVAAGTEPCEGLVTGFGSVWTVDCKSKMLLRVDPASGRVTARVPLPGTAPDGEGLITIDRSAVWVPATSYGPSGRGAVLLRVDPGSNSVAGTVKLPYDSSGAAAGFGSVWVTGAKTAMVYRVDPSTNAVVAKVKVHGSPRFIAAGAGAVWSLNQQDGSVSRIDPATNRVVATIKTNIPGSGGCITADLGRVWVTMPKTPLSEIDPNGNRIVGQWTGIGGDCITTGFGSVWLVNHDLKNVWRIKPRP